jgi:Zn-dependent protease with chaperone function
MTVVLGLVAFALLVTVGAPVLLARGSWRIRHPRRALRLWLLLLALGTGSFLCSIVVAATIVAARVDDRALHGWGPTAAALFAWCGLAVAGGVVALVVTRAEPLVASKQRSDVAVTLLMARATSRTERVGASEVGYLDTADVIACSTADGRILVSAAVADALTPIEVRAVVEHERAHVRLHHELVARVAAVNAASFPFLPGARAFRSSVALLVELVADDEAARVCGPAAVCNALVAMARLTPDPGLELRAARLAAAPVHSYPHRRRLDPVRASDR